MKKQSGFSLIELLVVVAIIGFLSAIGLTLFSEAQKKARDGQRKLDITSIAKTLEIHKTDTGTYQSLDKDWFEKGAILADQLGTTKGKYCGCEDATEDPTDDGTAGADWPDIKDCPVSGKKGCTIAWTEIKDGVIFPSATATKWYVCAHMEISDEVFCKHNVQ